MPSVHRARWSFFPLDEELGLVPSRCTPRLVGQIARLGSSCVSFGEAQALLSSLLGVELATDTVRRITELSGQHAAAIETTEAARLAKTMARPAVSVIDRLQQVSVDGVMVAIVGGTWEEAKCAAIGRIEQTSEGPKAVDLSYFARLTDASHFIAEARVEMHRRGTENAREVVAVSDGAEWIQRYIEEHCPHALRIIDWSHAVGYLYLAGQALFAAGTGDCVAWTKTQVDLLWAGNAELVVAELTRLQDVSERLKAVSEARHYLEKRLDMLRYAAFRAGGYPIGSGIVESANKVVVEARLKGAGKHWKRDNVNSLLALRCAAENGRWRTNWPQTQAAMRRPHRHRPQPKAVPPPVAPQPNLDPAIPGRNYIPVFDNGKPNRNHSWKNRPSRRAKT